ncbi:MAG: ribonuclease III family protein [Candidatus Bathyarchaeia archaeon]
MSRRALEEVLRDRGLAQLGDAYVNFICSLAASISEGRPRGLKVSDAVLAEAAKRCGARALLPKRSKREDIANAAEALLVYAWILGIERMEDAVELLCKAGGPSPDALSGLLRRALAGLQGPPRDTSREDGAEDTRDRRRPPSGPQGDRAGRSCLPRRPLA